MAKRINIILPDIRLATINQLVKPGERRRFIDRAIQYYVATRSTLGLRELIKQTAIRVFRLSWKWRGRSTVKITENA